MYEKLIITLGDVLDEDVENVMKEIQHLLNSLCTRKRIKDYILERAEDGQILY